MVLITQKIVYILLARNIFYNGSEIFIARSVTALGHD